MANTQKYLNHLLQSVGITPACSEEERAAAEEIARIFSNHGFEPEVQEFTSSSSPKLVRAVLCLLLFIGVLLTGFGGAIGLVGTLLVVVCGVLFMLERFGRMTFPRIGAGGLSQNVIAYHKAAGPLASPRNRPVVVVAHYDSPRADFLAQMPFAAYRPILVKLLPFAMVIPVAVAIVRLLPIPTVASLILWIVALLISLVPLVSALSVLANRYVLPYTSGAVCNKSSVAAMLGVMDAVSPFKGAKEFPEDMPFAAYMAEQRREFNDAFMEAAAANGQAPVIERGVSEETFEEEPDEDAQQQTRFSLAPEATDESDQDEVIPLTGATVQMPAVDLPGPIDAPVDVSPNEGAQAALDSLDRAPAPVEDEPETEEEIPAEEAPAAEPVEQVAEETYEEEPPLVNDAGCIRFGLDTLRGLGMVPETCVIEYEPNALPKPKPKAVLNFKIRQTAPKLEPEPVLEPAPVPAASAAVPAAPVAEQAPRAIADVPVPQPVSEPVLDSAPVAPSAPIDVAPVAEVQQSVAPAAYADEDDFESDVAAPAEEAYDYAAEAEADDAYDAYEEGADEAPMGYEEVDVPGYTASTYGQQDAAAYVPDEDEDEDAWEDDLDVPMEAIFETVDDEDDSEDYDEDEIVVTDGDEDASVDDGEPTDDDAYDYDEAQEALYDEVLDEDEGEDAGIDEEDMFPVDEVENEEEYDEFAADDDDAIEDEVETEDDAEVESYEQLEEPAEDPEVAEQDAGEEYVAEDTCSYEEVEEPEVTEVQTNEVDPFAAGPDADGDAEEKLYSPFSNVNVEHLPFEQQEDGSWTIGAVDDASAAAVEPDATAVMAALADPDAIETEYVEPVIEEADVEILDGADEEAVEEPVQTEEAETEQTEEADEEEEQPVEDIDFDESMFDFEPLAEDLDIMEAIYEPVDDEDDSAEVVDGDEVVFGATEDGQPHLDHTVEFKVPVLTDEPSDVAEPEPELSEISVEDSAEQPVETVEELVFDQVAVPEPVQIDETPEVTAVETAASDQDVAAIEPEPVSVPVAETEPVPASEPVRHEIRSIPNLPLVEMDETAPESAEKPLAGSTQLFDMASVIDRTMPAVPDVPEAPRETETVDSIMSEIEHDIPQRRQRSIKLPDITPTGDAVPQNRSRSPLFDLPDPAAAKIDPLASSSSSVTSSSAKGGTAQFTVVSSEETPKPSSGSFETISAPSPTQGKKRRGLGGLFGRKKKRDEESMSEWLGVDDDYDAKSSGRNIGSWDKFNGDDSWKGGAASDGTLTEDELRGAVASLGDDELLGHDIWFVATGSSENGNAGIREFLDAHRDKLRGVFLINLECIGAGRLAMLKTEGERRVLKGDKRIMGLISRVSSDFHHEIGSVDMPYLDTDAHAAMEMSLRACTLAGVEGPSLACSHSQEDISLNVDTSNIALAADVITEVIRRS